jgi:hypothetical protein
MLATAVLMAACFEYMDIAKQPIAVVVATILFASSVITAAILSRTE